MINIIIIIMMMMMMISISVFRYDDDDDDDDDDLKGMNKDMGLGLIGGDEMAKGAGDVLYQPANPQ